MTKKEFYTLLRMLTECGAKHHLDFRMLKEKYKLEFWEKFHELEKKGGRDGNPIEQK